MDNLSTTQNFSSNLSVSKGKIDLSKYFHKPDEKLNERFLFLYKLFGITDDSLATEIGIDRTTMGRYRRGIFLPSSKMKLLIAQKISKLSNYLIDSSIIWGEDLFFENFKKEKEERKND